MILRTLHGTSALVIVAFASVHIANHLVALAGASSHIKFMEAARSVYRVPGVETLLWVCIALQGVSGLTFIARDWKQRRGFVPWLQAASGGYLALFLLIHVSAIVFGRAVLKLDTNFYFAAAGLHVSPFELFFAPYYFLAVVALFTHLGCAAYRRLQARSRAIRTLPLALAVPVGCGVSLLIVLALTGVPTPVEVPPQYQAIYARR